MGVISEQFLGNIKQSYGLELLTYLQMFFLTIVSLSQEIFLQ